MSELYQLIKFNSVYKEQVKDILVPTKYFYKYTNRSLLLMVLSFLNLYTNYFYLLIDKRTTKALGCILLRHRISKKSIRKSWWIYGVYIRDDFRGKGLGKIIINESIKFLKLKYAKEVYLYVDKSNLAAINLYESYGFQKLDMCDLHENRDNEHLMIKKFK